MPEWANESVNGHRCAQLTACLLAYAVKSIFPFWMVEAIDELNVVINPLSADLF